MFRPHTVLLIAAICGLAGCATTPTDPLVARQNAYERLASFIEPGMTRRQLYALLPPQRPAMTVAVPDPGFSSIPALLRPQAFQTETYPLDQNLDVQVEYLLANSALSKTWSFSSDSLIPPEARSRPLVINAHAVDVHYTASNSASLSISAAKIDELLFGKAAKSKRSKQNMDDRISSRPRVVFHQR
jgi:hypothetical protein